MNLPVGRPLGVVGFGGDGCQFFRIGSCAGGGVEVGEPDLLAVFAAGEEEDALVVGGELEAVVAGLGNGELNGIATCDGLKPQLRCFCVLARSTVVTL